MSQSLNVKTLKLSSKEKFFIYWLEFLKPFHKLRDKEVLMLAYFLDKRHSLSLKIADEALIDRILFSQDVRNEIREKMSYSNHQVFNNMLSSLRKKGIIKDNKIIPGLIPELKGDNFKLVFNFIIDGQTTEENN